jgi:uncharacterized protein (DUF1330 family)
MRFQQLLFIGSIVLASCVREDIAERIEIGMYANVAADSFATENAKFSFTFGNVLKVEGATNDSLKIILELDSADQPGIYDLSNTAKYEGIFIDSLKRVFSTKFTGSGSVEIERITQTTVEGTFEFTARNLNL